MVYHPLLLSPLRYHLRDQRGGEVLATRREGTRTAQHLRELHDGRQDIVLDFDGVIASSIVFLSELLDGVAAILANVPKEQPRPLVAVANVHDDVLPELEEVLDRRDSMVAVVDDDEVRLVAGTPKLNKTLQIAREFPATFTVNELAARLDAKPNAVGERLTPLFEAGVLSREADPDAEHGTRYKYRAPQPDHLLTHN
jgi:DNA-binding transcriptional ArsR family regulator